MFMIKKIKNNGYSLQFMFFHVFLNIYRYIYIYIYMYIYIYREAVIISNIQLGDARTILQVPSLCII